MTIQEYCENKGLNFCDKNVVEIHFARESHPSHADYFEKVKHWGPVVGASEEVSGKTKVLRKKPQICFILGKYSSIDTFENSRL